MSLNIGHQWTKLCESVSSTDNDRWEKITNSHGNGNVVKRLLYEWSCSTAKLRPRQVARLCM